MAEYSSSEGDVEASIEDVEEEVICEENVVNSDDAKKCKSQVWKFFNKKGERSVTCSICNASLAYHGGTSSMLQHLKRKHPIENPIKPADKQKQTKLDVFSRKRVCSPEQASAVSDRIANLMIKDLWPINIVSGQGFQDLMAFLEPGYHLPSNTHFTHLIE